MLFELQLAIACDWGKTAGLKALRLVSNYYIELIRKTQFLVQLPFFFFALAHQGRSSTLTMDKLFKQTAHSLFSATKLIADGTR